MYIGSSPITAPLYVGGISAFCISETSRNRGGDYFCCLRFQGFKFAMVSDRHRDLLSALTCNVKL